MVWEAISYHGKLELRFVRSSVKINSVSYIHSILKPMLEEDIPCLNPGEDAIFHQDSAPSHGSQKNSRISQIEKYFIH